MLICTFVQNFLEKICLKNSFCVQSKNQNLNTFSKTIDEMQKWMIFSVLLQKLFKRLNDIQNNKKYEKLVFHFFARVLVGILNGKKLLSI